MNDILHNFPAYMETPQKQKVTYKSVYEMIDGTKRVRPKTKMRKPQPTHAYYFDWRTPLTNIWRAFIRL